MNDEAPIRAALDTWRQSFCRKDADTLIALYAPDAVSFDAIPPFADTPESLRRKVLDCFPHFPEGFAIETRDLALEVSGGLAHAHFLWRFTGLPPGHPAGRHWLRSSIVWRKQADAAWRIVHDHCSAPFDPYTEKVVLSPDGGEANGAAPGCGDANPVGWFEIYVADMERAKAFYAAVLGYPLSPLESGIEMWAFPMQSGGYGASGALVRMPGLDPGGNTVIVYFGCADCAVQAARAAEAGGVIVKPKFSIGQYGHIALVRDTDGNLIGLHSRP